MLKWLFKLDKVKIIRKKEKKWKKKNENKFFFLFVFEVVKKSV